MLTTYCYNSSTAWAAAVPVSTEKTPFFRLASLLKTVTAQIALTSAAPFTGVLQDFQVQVEAWCLPTIVFHRQPTLCSDPAAGPWPLLLSLIPIFWGNSRFSHGSRSQGTNRSQCWQTRGDVAHRAQGLTAEWTFRCSSPLRPTCKPFIKLPYYIWSFI